jgi:hypothetical protein
VATDADFDRCFRAEFPRLVALGTAMSGSAEVRLDELATG